MKDLNRLQAVAIAASWIQNLRAAAPKYRAGIAACKVNPMELAAQQENFWAQRVAEAARQNRFSSALMRVRVDDWKNAAIQVGAERIANLQDIKQRKQIAFWQRFLPVLISVTNQTRAMPKQTYEQRRARAVAQMDGLHNQANGGVGQFQGIGQIAGM